MIRDAYCGPECPALGLKMTAIATDADAAWQERTTATLNVGRTLDFDYPEDCP